MEEAKQRKVRSDKGKIIATERDQYVIAWIGEQWAARFDQIQKLLGKFSDPSKPFRNGEYPAATTVRDQLGRWQSAGWIGYERSLYAGNSWIWATRKGLRFVDLDEIYTARRPADTRLNHIFAVNEVRMFLQKKYTWISERRLRSEMPATKKGLRVGPIADGLIVHPKAGRIGIEVQISPLKSAEMERKLRDLAWYEYLDPVTLRDGHKYPVIWFYTHSESIKNSIEAARDKLTASDQKRIFTALEPWIISRPGR
jgi:hypothetical protein